MWTTQLLFSWTINWNCWRWQRNITGCKQAHKIKEVGGKRVLHDIDIKQKRTKFRAPGRTADGGTECLCLQYGPFWHLRFLGRLLDYCNIYAPLIYV